MHIISAADFPGLILLKFCSKPYSTGRMLVSKISYSARNSAGRIYPILGKCPSPDCPRAFFFLSPGSLPSTKRRLCGGESSWHQNKNTSLINLKCFLYDYLRLIYPSQVVQFLNIYILPGGK